MKLVYVTFLLVALRLSTAVGQTPAIDSLQRLLVQTRPDTSRVQLLERLSVAYRSFQPDSALILVRQALALARRLHYVKGEGRAMSEIGSVLRFRGEFPQALKAYFSALQFTRDHQDQVGEANILAYIGTVYSEMSAYRLSLRYHQQGKEIYARLSNNGTNKMRVSDFMMQLSNIGETYLRMNKLDSALFFQQRAYALKQQLPRRSVGTLILIRLGIVMSRLGNASRALALYQDALQETYLTGDHRIRVTSQHQLAELYHQLNQPDSSFKYAQRAYLSSKRVVVKRVTMEASSLLAKLYKIRNNPDSALRYQELTMAARDSLFSPEKYQRLQLLTFTEQQRQQQQREEQARAQTRLQRTGLLLVVTVALFIALLLWRNNRQKQRANRALNQKNEQIQRQHNALEQTLTELKATQTQLILREKMASLGELTAGIAHEIQNPLNFVTNFSGVSVELIEELQQELAAGEIAETKAISEIIKQNLGKIVHHGHRADSIVKGMLQHSRTNTGEKQATDLNALAAEYLRLAHQGFRTKDQGFNANFITDFDAELKKVEVVPQEIGRVLLNLYNNAFYATQQKKAQVNEIYQPEVKVSTHHRNGKVEIKVRDNGTGIPERVKDKIFQPFFTTKPTGQGTGLGLSLSYDIITKGHGGELIVETKEGEFSEFIVTFTAT